MTSKVRENAMREKQLENPTGTVTEIYNNKKIVIDGCDGIIDFSDEIISIKSGRLKISIVGNRLKIIIFSKYNIVIEGYITSVNYTYL